MRSLLQFSLDLFAPQEAVPQAPAVAPLSAGDGLPPAVFRHPRSNREARLGDAGFRRLMVNTTPFPRIGTPQDVAGAIHFLCSEDAGFVNGHVLVIDGGWSATNSVGTPD